MPIAELTSTVSKQPNQTTIHISGYLSSENAESRETAFAELDSQKVLLNFDEKCFLNSAGLAVLMDLLLPLKDEGKETRLVHPKAYFRRVFEITGMARDFEVAAD